MASFHHRVKTGKPGTAAYRSGYIGRRGKYGGREDLVASGHGNMPVWANDDPRVFWKAADKYERANAAVYREHEIALPGELTQEQQLELVGNLRHTLVGDRPYQYAVHAPTSSLAGVPNAHVHLMYSDRQPDGIERGPEQTFRRYNARQPELGGARKASGGKNPLQLRGELIEDRGKCADLQNAALAKHGHEARVDHRSLRQQGVEREPERHLGPARISQMSSEEKTLFAANRAQPDR